MRARIDDLTHGPKKTGAVTACVTRWSTRQVPVNAGSSEECSAEGRNNHGDHGSRGGDFRAFVQATLTRLSHASRHVLFQAVASGK